MKFRLMQEVIVQSDVLNLGAPVGKSGFVVRVDRLIDQAQPYCVRVPDTKEFYWLPECDILDVGEWTSSQADEVIRTSLVDTALSKRDQATFDAVVKGQVE